jgi:hypothetical protein
MTERAVAAQQQVISIRISDALRSRLERLRAIMAPQERPNGLDIGTSNAAS